MFEVRTIIIFYNLKIIFRIIININTIIIEKILIGKNVLNV